MAAARGDPRRRPGSVFTVHAANCGPGPCRDGLNTGCNTGFSRDALASRNARRSIFASYSKDVLNSESSDELSKLSRDGSKDDVLSEVRVHTPLSRSRRPSQRRYSQQVSRIFMFRNEKIIFTFLNVSLRHRYDVL